MNLDEKLDQFYSSVMEDASAINSSMIKEFEDALETMQQQHKADTLRKAELTLKVESDDLIRQKNRDLSMASLEIKRKLSDSNQALMDRLFTDVILKLKEFMQTKEYDDLLLCQIKGAIDFADNDTMIVYINASDSHKKEALEHASGVTLTISTIDFLGGIRAVLSSRKVLIDQSFSSKIEEEKSTFKLD